MKTYRQAVLKKAFEGELTKEWRAQQTDLPTAEELLVQIKEERERHFAKQMEEWETAVAEWEGKGKVGRKPGKPRKGKELRELTEEELSELPVLPNGWEYIRPSQIASTEKYSIGIGPFGSNLKVSDYTESGMPLVFVRNITRNDFSLNIKFTSIKKYDELIAHSVKPLDILITKMGNPPGDCAIYPKNAPNGIISSDCLKFRIWEKYGVRMYFKYCIESYFIKKQLGVITQGVAQKKISTERFKTIFFPLPPLKEQHQIVQEIETRLSVCDKVEESIEASLAKAKALRQSILKKAFEGRLLTEAELTACKKEADWEPAGVLLERIREEKAVKEYQRKKSR